MIFLLKNRESMCRTKGDDNNNSDHGQKGGHAETIYKTLIDLKKGEKAKQIINYNCLVKY